MAGGTPAPGDLAVERVKNRIADADGTQVNRRRRILGLVRAAALVEPRGDEAIPPVTALLRLSTALFAVAAAAAVVVLHGAGALHVAATPASVLVLFGLMLVLAEAAAQSTRGGHLMAFSATFVVAGMVALGPSPGVVAVALLAGPLAMVRMTRLSGGPWGLGFNASLNAVEVLTAAAVVWSLGDAHLLVRIVAASAALWFANVVLVTPVLVAAGAGSVRAVLIERVRSEVGGQVALLGVSVTGALSVTAYPTAGLVAMSSPVLLALHLHRAHMRHARAEEQLTLDAMTGVANKTHFWARLETELLAVAQRRRAIAVLMLDIDDFKLLNDGHGHVEGDRAICAVAQAARASVGANCLVARFGGEEFGIVLPDVGAEQAGSIGERVRAAAASGLADWSATVSVGVAFVEAGGDAPRSEDIVSRADALLYDAKRHGKDRVCLGAVPALADPTAPAAAAA